VTTLAPTEAQARPLHRCGSGLTMAFGDEVVQRDLTFDIRRGEVLAIVGASGCGKSTLLRHLIGLQTPPPGQVLYGDRTCTRRRRDPGRAAPALRRDVPGRGAVELDDGGRQRDAAAAPVHRHWPAAERERRARWKLALVGLEDAFELEPGRAQRRHAQARRHRPRAGAGPGAALPGRTLVGTGPVQRTRLDGLILNLRGDLGTTVVMVTHSIDSVFAVADRE
jgi:phospholipid/cholesterol/gamma-HCH transport system ATP-binding protein